MRQCDCVKERYIQAQLPARYLGAKLKDFNETLQKQIVGWVEKPTDGLLLTGGVGTGKTYLAAAILRYRMERWGKSCFLRAADFYAMIRATYSTAPPPDGYVRRTEDQVIDFYASAELCILDDLGSGSLSDHERRCTLELLDQRLNAQRPTIVTTNWPLKKIGELMDERIESRLATFTAIAFRGKDRRADLKAKGGDQ